MPAAHSDAPKAFCMDLQDGKWTLKMERQYFFQVQAQLNICNADMGVFVVWTAKEVIHKKIEKRDSVEMSRTT